MTRLSDAELAVVLADAQKHGLMPSLWSAALLQLRDDLDAVTKDSARYQWLRSRMREVSINAWVQIGLTPECLDLDDAVDAAMAAHAPTPEGSK